MLDDSLIRWRLAATVTTEGSSSGAQLVVSLIVLFLLILIHAFFSATEIAVITLNDNKIRKRAEEGDKIARVLTRMIDNPGKFLATIQVGVTLAGFLSSAFAAEFFASRLYQAIGLDTAWVRSASVVVVTFVLAYFSLVLGELVPKRVAQQNPEKFSYAVARIISVLGVALKPFVSLLTVSTNIVLRVLGIDPNQNDRTVTEEEIRMMVDVGRESGNIDASEKQLIDNIFEFNDKEVSEVMTHRTNIAALSIDASYREVLDVTVHEKYTRIPVFEESIDSIVGILHSKDLLTYVTSEHDKPFTLRDLLRAPYFVPESKSVDVLFREMQRARQHLAVVIDEYGGTAGIITVEDLLEEIVGNIQDEYDEEEQEIVRKDERTYVVAGMAALSAVGETLGMTFPEDDFDTLAGLVISLLGRIPEEGEKPEVDFGDLHLKVLDMDEKRVSRVQITLKEKLEPALLAETE